MRKCHTLFILFALVLMAFSANAADFTSAERIYSYAKAGNTTALKLLKDVDIADNNGNTALCLALINHDRNAYDILQNAGANPKAECVGKIGLASGDVDMDNVLANKKSPYSKYSPVPPKSATFLGMGTAGWTAVAIVAAGGTVAALASGKDGSSKKDMTEEEKCVNEGYSTASEVSCEVEKQYKKSCPYSGDYAKCVSRTNKIHCSSFSTSADTCTSCQVGWKVVEGQCSECDTARGYVGNGTKCTNCYAQGLVPSADGLECVEDTSGSNFCTEQGYVRNSYDCEDGYEIDTRQFCTYEDVTYYLCVAKSDETPKCGPHAYSQEQANLKCARSKQCQKNDGTTAYECTVCASQYSSECESGTYSTNSECWQGNIQKFTCESCEAAIDKCTSCTSANYCTACKFGFVPTSDNRGCECPSGTHHIVNGICVENSPSYCANSGKTLAEMNCLIGNVLKCTASNNVKYYDGCYMCSENYVYDSNLGICVKDVEPCRTEHTYAENEIGAGKACVSGTECLKTDGTTAFECTQCNSEYDKESCNGNEGWEEDGTCFTATQTLLKCKAATCEAKYNTPNACANGKYPTDGGCWTGGVHKFECANCSTAIDHCTECSNANTCTRCDTGNGWYLNGSTCAKCDAGSHPNTDGDGCVSDDTTPTCSAAQSSSWYAENVNNCSVPDTSSSSCRKNSVIYYEKCSTCVEAYHAENGVCVGNTEADCIAEGFVYSAQFLDQHGCAERPSAYCLINNATHTPYYQSCTRCERSQDGYVWTADGCVNACEGYYPTSSFGSECLNITYCSENHNMIKCTQCDAEKGFNATPVDGKCQCSSPTAVNNNGVCVEQETPTTDCDESANPQGKNNCSASQCVDGTWICTACSDELAYTLKNNQCVANTDADCNLKGQTLTQMDCSKGNNLVCKVGNTEYYSGCTICAQEGYTYNTDQKTCIPDETPPETPACTTTHTYSTPQAVNAVCQQWNACLSGTTTVYECTECDAKYNTSGATCGTGKYQVTASGNCWQGDTQKIECQSCSAHCSTCTDANTCTACTDGYQLNNNNACECPSETHEINDQGQCVEKSSGGDTLDCGMHGTQSGDTCDCDVGWGGTTCNRCDTENGWSQSGSDCVCPNDGKHHTNERQCLENTAEYCADLGSKLSDMPHCTQGNSVKCTTIGGDVYYDKCKTCDVVNNYYNDNGVCEQCPPNTVPNGAGNTCIDATTGAITNPAGTTISTGTERNDHIDGIYSNGTPVINNGTITLSDNSVITCGIDVENAYATNNGEITLSGNGGENKKSSYGMQGTWANAHLYNGKADGTVNAKIILRGNEGYAYGMNGAHGNITNYQNASIILQGNKGYAYGMSLQGSVTATNLGTILLGNGDGETDKGNLNVARGMSGSNGTELYNGNTDGAAAQIILRGNKDNAYGMGGYNMTNHKGASITLQGNENKAYGMQVSGSSSGSTTATNLGTILLGNGDNETDKGNTGYAYGMQGGVDSTLINGNADGTAPAQIILRGNKSYAWGMYGYNMTNYKGASITLQGNENKAYGMQVSGSTTATNLGTILLGNDKDETGKGNTGEAYGMYGASYVSNGSIYYPTLINGNEAGVAAQIILRGNEGYAYGMNGAHGNITNYQNASIILQENKGYAYGMKVSGSSSGSTTATNLGTILLGNGDGETDKGNLNVAIGMSGSNGTELYNGNTDGAAAQIILRGNKSNAYGMDGCNIINYKGASILLQGNIGQASGMRVSGSTTATNLGTILLGNDKDETGKGNTGVAYGMYGASTYVSNGSIYYPTLINGNEAGVAAQIILRGNKDNAYGMGGYNMTNHKGASILLQGNEKIAYGMRVYGSSSGSTTATNAGTITLTDNTGTAYGIYATNDSDYGVSVVNRGTIELSGNGRSIGIWAQGTNVTVTNSGTIKVDNMAALTCTTGSCDTGNYGIVALGGATIATEGLITAPTSLNLGTNSGGGVVLASRGARFEVGDEISGDLTMSSDVVAGGFDTTYSVDDMISAGDVSGLNLLSQSALFDAHLENESDAVLTMKSFNDVVENQSVADFLAQNYAEGNNEQLFATLKSATSVAQLNRNIDDLFGKKMLSRMAFEDLSMVREVSLDMNNQLFKQEGAFAFGGNVSPSSYDNNTGSVGRYSLNGYNKGKMSFGVGVSITDVNTNDGDKGNSRFDRNFMLSAPVGYKTHGFELITAPKMGYSDGDYDREGLGKTYKGKVTKRMLALMNEARYPVKFGGVKFVPTAEFNMIGYNIKAHEDEQAYSLRIKSQNHYSVEAGLGLMAEKEFKLFKEHKFNVSGGVAVYHEFANPYELDVTMNGMSGTYRLRDERRSDERAAVRFGFGYALKDYLDVTANLLTNIDREYRTDANFDLRYRF